MKKVIITVIFVIAAVILGIKGRELLKSKENEIKNEKPPIESFITVTTTHCKEGTLEKRIPFLAHIIADKSIKVSTKFAGYIKEVYVQESQKVKKGDLLAKIDSKEFTSNIKALKATIKAQESDVALAKSIYERNVKLYKVGGLAKEKLDISKVALKSKRALLKNSKEKLNQLKHQLTYLKIVAPFDGVIENIFAHKGDLAAAGKPILSMNNSKKRVIISYAPSAANKIKKDQKVFIKDGQIGYINFIYTTSTNGLVSAEVKLTKDIDLPTGSDISVNVLTEKESGCLLPDNTIVHKKDGVYVMVYENKTFKPFKVDLKLKEGNRIVISPFVKLPIARANEAKLAELPAYNNINIAGETK